MSLGLFFNSNIDCKETTCISTMTRGIEKIKHFVVGFGEKVNARSGGLSVRTFSSPVPCYRFRLYFFIHRWPLAEFLCGPFHPVSLVFFGISLYWPVKSTVTLVVWFFRKTTITHYCDLFDIYENCHRQHHSKKKNNIHLIILRYFLLIVNVTN